MYKSRICLTKTTFKSQLVRTTHLNHQRAKMSAKGTLVLYLCLKNVSIFSLQSEAQVTKEIPDTMKDQGKKWPQHVSHLISGSSPMHHWKSVLMRFDMEDSNWVDSLKDP